MRAEDDRFLHLDRSQDQFGDAFVGSLSAISSTQSFAFSAEAQQMCSGDAFRLCSSEIPNIPKITACMIKQRVNLSSGCRIVLERDLAAQSYKVAAQ
jgi:hypothetical protein